MTKTMEEKRAFVKEHLAIMASREEASAALARANARKSEALSRFYKHRIDILDTIDDVSIDLMIEDWNSKLSVEANQQQEARANKAFFMSIDAFIFGENKA